MYVKCSKDWLYMCFLASVGHASLLTPAQTPWSILFSKFTLQNKAYPDFDKACDWLISFSSNSCSPRLKLMAWSNNLCDLG